MKTYRNITEIKAANKAAGQHWFAPSTLRFFDSRVESKVIAGCYFVTSEKSCWNNYSRVYTLRKCEADGTIETVSKYGEFLTKKEALDEAKALVVREARAS